MANNERNWNDLVAELSEMMAGGYEGTSVEVILGDDNRSIEVYPKKGSISGAFHYGTEIIDFCRCKRLGSYFFPRICNDRIECCARIY